MNSSKRSILRIIFITALLISACQGQAVQQLTQTQSQNDHNTESVLSETPVLSFTPIPRVTTVLSPTSTLTPLPTAIPDLHERILVCQPSQAIDDLALHFYWLDLSCLNREDACRNILEPYFDFYMKYQGERSRLNFSRDGQLLLYLVNRNLYDQNKDLYVYDVPSGVSTPMSFNTNIEYVQYAAQGDKVLYLTRNAGLYLTDASGSGWQIVSDYFVSMNAAFSPDGKKIAFAGEPRALPDSCKAEAGTSDLFIYLTNLENGENTVRQLSPLRVEEGHCGQLFYAHPLAWSADSSRLVYTRQVAQQEEIVCMMNLDDQVERCFPDGIFASIGRYDLSVEDQLVLAGIRQGNQDDNDVLLNDLYVLDMYTGQIRQITETQADERNPYWVENDHLITYEWVEDGIQRIALTDREGNWHKLLTDDVSSYYFKGECSNIP